MTTDVTIGLDPGAKSGGIAWIASTGSVGVEPFSRLSEAEVVEYIKWVRGLYTECHAVLECIRARPRIPPSTISKLSAHYGFLRGVLTDRVDYTEVTPAVWMPAVGMPRKLNYAKRKTWLRETAQEWYPDVRVTHATAAALLLAEYGRNKR